MIKKKSIRLGDETQKLYASFLNKPNLAETAGRHAQALGSGKHIWNDIKNKLNIQNNSSLLDIGCGFGEVTQCMLEDLMHRNISLTLIDASEILEQIKKSFSSYLKNDVFFVPGYFPENSKLLNHNNKFDSILSYSVIQLADSPEKFIESAVQLLAPGGKLFLGDFPNVNKKGRFLSTPYGRQFDAAYKNIDIEEVPNYENQYSFINSEFNKINHIMHINDDLLLYIMKKYRNQGYELYVLPQPTELPFSKTREDILIVSPH